jgi:transposase
LRLPLDRLVPLDHPVRHVEALVASLDFTDLFDRIRAREGQPGRPPFDPRMLFALWLYACIEGVGSARELAKLCRRDLPFLWLSGQTKPNYHTLSDFYSDNEAFLQTAFTDHIEALLEHRLVTLKEVTLDGRKIAANASKESFHRAPTLNRHRQEAEEHLAKLAEQRASAKEQTRRREVAQQRAARERQERLAQAVATVQKRHQERAARGSRKDEAPPDQTRASETDPDARKMKMSHGGYTPAYNTQTVTDTENGLIVTIRVTDDGSDSGLLRPMLEQVADETGRLPERGLVDGGYVNQEDIEWAETAGITMYMPPKNEKADLKKGKDPYAPKRWDPAKVAAWRQRMGTDEAKTIYRRRAPVAEGVHAQQANHGWRRHRLRGLVKAQVEAYWQALAYNIRVLIARNHIPRLVLRAAGA